MTLQLHQKLPDMKNLFTGILLCYTLSMLSQRTPKASGDSNYLEDQIYTSITYNITTNRPKGVKQNGFSGGFSLGFIKDIPFNTRRNFGLGLGIGYNYNAYIQNILISETDQNISASIVSNYKSNRFVTNAIEFPLEIRWRTSTATDYKFTRIYIGGKLNYAFQTSSKMSDNAGVIKTKNIAAFNKLHYGLTAAIGYSTFNLYMYYGLKPMFKSLQIGTQKLEMKEFQIGLKFYIL
ncbi:MAG: hypothetical protein COB60_01440 [Flavobacteriaceae bacterium]|nr:MAG: hypothetical protein COB60_01440 [Flavobacteriaceae bacterium]